LPGGPAIGTEHIGPYDTLGLAYAALSAWLSEHGATAASPPWEVYFSEPTGDPATWRTGVLQPYAAANAGAVA
jgi:effector-binding domain-containing protein